MTEEKETKKLTIVEPIFPWLWQYHDLALVPLPLPSSSGVVIPMALMNLQDPPLLSELSSSSFTYRQFRSFPQGPQFRKIFHQYCFQIARFQKLYHQYEAAGERHQISLRIAQLTQFLISGNKVEKKSMAQWFQTDSHVFFEVTLRLLSVWVRLGQDRVWVDLWRFFRSYPLHLTHQSFVDRMICKMNHRIPILKAASACLVLWTPILHDLVPKI
jgi:hypothetical protein